MSVNIINSIDLIRKNKKYFTNAQEYNQILTYLYQELSNKNMSDMNIDFDINFNSLKFSSKKYLTDEEYICLLNLIIEKTYTLENCLKIENIKLICQKLPLFSMYLKNLSNNGNFLEDKYIICDLPIINNEYNKILIVTQIKMLLKMCEISNGDNKVIIFIILYDFIMRNFKFVLDNKKFGKTFFEKLKEVSKNDNDKLNLIIEKYNIDSKIIDKWIEVLENLYL